MTNRRFAYFGWHDFGRLLRVVMTVLGFMAFGSASAAIVVTSTIGDGPAYAYSLSNFGGLGTGNGGLSTGNGGLTSVKLDVPTSHLVVDKFSKVDGGNFSFKANSYCTINCFASTSGITTLTILNDSDASVDLRFDSQITAGHLGFQSLFKSDNTTSASFNFSITELRLGETTGKLLYGATGIADINNLSIVTTDNKDFNGLDSFHTGTQKVYDWSATNLDLGLGILAAHETVTLLYRSDTTIFAGPPCTTLECTNVPPCATGTMCDGAQVCFGDPRRSGGVIGNRVAFAAPAANLEPVVGQACGVASVSFAVVDAGSPLPPPLPTLPPVVYALPEPSTWALLIIGFGCSGIALRRQAALRPVVA